MMHSLPPPKNALPCSGITSTFLVSNMCDPGCPCTWSQAGIPGSPLGPPRAGPVVLDLHAAESEGAIRGHLEAWGIIITPVLWESFVLPRLRRLQQEWPNAGSTSSRRSELTAAQHTALLFLHMKDLGSTLPDFARATYFRALVLEPAIGEFRNPAGFAAAYKAHKRLMFLVGTPRDLVWEGPRSGGPAPDGLGDIQMWADFVATHPEWRDSTTGASVFFEHTSPGSVKQRAQIHGTCYMQAPNVLVHYLCCLHHGGAPPSGVPTMTDLTKLRLRHFSANHLWMFITQDQGGYAEEFLRELCTHPGTYDTTDLSRARLADDAIIANLARYGPALVSTINIKGEEVGDDPVYDHRVHHHAGVDDVRVPVKKLLYHAVLIVGHRRCGDGSVQFLVQNWWKHKQFFTCDLEFLKHRNASLVWVTTPVASVRVLQPDEVVTANIAQSAPDGAATCDVYSTV